MTASSPTSNPRLLVTALSTKLGYGEIAHTAYQDGSSLREACLKLGYLTGEEFDGIVRPAAMTHP